VRQPVSPLPFLTQLPDERDPRRITYRWDTLWTLVLVGLLSAPDNILALSQWLKNHREVLCLHLNIPDVPAQATLYRFFWHLEQRLDLVQSLLLAWVTACLPPEHRPSLTLLSADGKTLRGSSRPGERALSFLSVFLHDLSQTVLQVPLLERHEARVLDELLETVGQVFGEHWLMVLDAAYTERDLAAHITAQGGQYLLPLKNNVADLKAWAELVFTYPNDSTFVDQERRSGQTWRRTVCVQTILPEALLDVFPQARTLIQRTHEITRRDGTTTTEVRYAVSSALLTAQQAEQVWRTHWGIENRSHHRRDTLFREDACWTRKAAQSLAVLHGVVLTVLHAQTPYLTALVRRLRSNPLACLQLLGLPSR
jgi:predicted transposase YbfD/YdcC